MKLHKSQSGFAPILVVLILVVLGAAGFAGWKVYDTNKKKTDNQSAASTPATATETEGSEPASNIPAGFVEYKNTKLGFKFSYPKEWGDIEDTGGTFIFRSMENNNSVLRISANPKSECPQGDGPGLSDSQGWYEKNGKYYVNWCKYSPESNGQEYEVAYGDYDYYTVEKLNSFILLQYNFSESGLDDDTHASAVGLVNLKKNPDYLGLSITRWWDEKRDKVKNADALAEFKKVLLTFTQL